MSKKTCHEEVWYDISRLIYALPHDKSEHIQYNCKYNMKQYTYSVSAMQTYRAVFSLWFSNSINVNMCLFEGIPVAPSFRVSPVGVWTSSIFSMLLEQQSTTLKLSSLKYNQSHHLICLLKLKKSCLEGFSLFSI